MKNSQLPPTARPVRKPGAAPQILRGLSFALVGGLGLVLGIGLHVLATSEDFPTAELAVLGLAILALGMLSGGGALALVVWRLSEELHQAADEFIQRGQAAFSARLDPVQASCAALDSKLVQPRAETQGRVVNLPAECPVPTSEPDEFIVVPPRIPRVEMAAEVLREIHDYVQEFLAEHGSENEVGGLLVGRFTSASEDTAGCLTITGLIGAGPKAEFSPGHINCDAEYQAEQQVALQWEHPQTCTVGFWHRHPGAYDECSDGDEVTDREAVEQSQTGVMAFLIVTVDNPAEDPTSLRHGNLKFDCFVMARATDYRYVKVRPALTQQPVQRVSPAMVTLLRWRGMLAGLDLAALRQLPGFGRFVLLTVEDGGPRLLLQVWDSVCERTYHLLVSPTGELRLYAMSLSGEAGQLPGPWEQPESGRHIWFSHLFALARERLAPASAGVTRFGPHLAWWHDDRQRLLVEIHAMEQKHGQRARLERRGEELYWSTTVRESGREFPIEIIYPPDYPATPPTIRSVRDLPFSPHRLGPHELCWTDTYGRHSDWNPARDTAVICVAAAQRWFACLLVFVTTGEWPARANH